MKGENGTLLYEKPSAGAEPMADKETGRKLAQMAKQTCNLRVRAGEAFGFRSGLLLA